MAAIAIGFGLVLSSSAASGWYAWTNNLFSTSNYTANVTSSNVSSNVGGAQMLTDMTTGSSLLAPMTGNVPDPMTPQMTNTTNPMIRSDIGTALSPSDNPTGISAGQPITVTLRCGGSV